MSAAGAPGSGAPSPGAPPLFAALAGQYAWERELGRGGMGIVCLARDLKLDRPVAIKILPPELAGDGAVRERFLREARTAAQLSHPNIVAVHRADEVDGQTFFVMAYVEGESLADRIRDRGALPPAEAVRWLREVAQALAYAHLRGVVHRDVKPENILIDRATGRAMVTDFGIARDRAASRLTADGHVLGTVHYMSPEQVTGEEIDGRSDLYSLGVVGYYALGGRLPFEGELASAVLVAHATRPAPPLASVAPQVPPQLAQVIDRCLAKDPAIRYGSGEALADALARAMETTLRAGDADESVVLSEEQAAALWRRAAQLQADALQRLDARVPARSGATAAHEATEQGGYSLRHVRAAAVEAGISEQFVALALAELPRDARGVPVVAEEQGIWQQREATRLLGTTERSCAVSRVMTAPPARVLRALGQVLQRPPFDLRLRDTVGGHPLDGGVIVFDLPGSVFTLAATGTNVSMQWMGTRHQLEAEHVQVTIKPRPADPGTCEVTMFVDLRPGVRRNVNASAIIAGFFAGAGGIGSGAILGAATALTALGAVVPGLVAGALFGLGSVRGYRALYRSTVRKAERELGAALDAVQASLKAEVVFGTLADSPPATAGALPRGATAGISDNS